MTGKHIVAADLGTGSCKTLLVDDGGVVLASAKKEYPCSYPHPGWCEQNPKDWLQAVGETVRSVLDQSGIQPSSVAAFGLDGVTHNAVLLDSQGKLLRPCIHFYDTRSQEESEELYAKWGDEIFRRTCNTISPIWTWPQMLWIKRHEPDVWNATRSILFQKDYVRNILAPSPVTDLIDAEGSLLFDPNKNIWIDEFMADLGLQQDALPQVVKPTEVVGEIGAIGAELVGLPKGTPVIAGTTDTVAEVFGAGALRVGQGTVKLASVGRITCVSASPANHSNMLNYRHVVDGLWYPGTATKNASSAFRWLRDAIWCDQDYESMSAAAASVPPGCDGLLFHPYLQGEWVPYWDSKLRGSFIGLTIRHGKNHMTRAVMEGVAFSLRAGVAYARSIGLPFDEIRLIGQGAGSSVWAQMIADTLNRKILIPVEKDAAYGTALLTGIGVGLFPETVDQVSELIRVQAEIEPDSERAERYNRVFGIYQQSAAALINASHQLADFEVKYS